MSNPSRPSTARSAADNAGPLAYRGPRPSPEDIAFEAEMEGERLRWLRRRFMWMCGITIALMCVTLPVVFLTLPDDGRQRSAQLGRAWWGVACLAAYASAMLFAAFRARRRRTISVLALGIVLAYVTLVTPVERWVTQLEGTSNLNAIVAEGRAETQREATRAASRSALDGVRTNLRQSKAIQAAATRAPSRGDRARDPVLKINLGSSSGSTTRQREAQRAVQDVVLDTLSALGDFTPARKTAMAGLWAISITHLVACLFMPWTLKESGSIAAAGLSTYGAVLAADTLGANLTMAGAGGCLALAALAMMPGLAVCGWRQVRFRSQFKLQFESGRYRELRGELEQARRIHESCMPAPLLTGPARFAYAYRPMRDIGGDLLFHRATGGGAHLVVIIDVTGHGIAAALTVNRLLGEIERVVGEAVDPPPAQVIAALNAYASLMLAEHGLYLSALAIRLDAETGAATYASGGHPTAYVLSPSRGQRELPSTAPLLGVVPPDEYHVVEEPVTLAPDEVIVACTDGATETTRNDGSMLRTAGMAELIARVAHEGGPAEAWPERVLRELDATRAGEMEDDTLVVVLRRAAT